MNSHQNYQNSKRAMLLPDPCLRRGKILDKYDSLRSLPLPSVASTLRYRPKALRKGGKLYGPCPIQRPKEQRNQPSATPLPYGRCFILQPAKGHGAAMPSSATRCISSVRICTSKCWPCGPTTVAVGCLPLRCEWLDYGATKQEVVIPAVAPRVEEAHELSTQGIDRADVAPFPRIASNAGIREVAGIRRSAVLTTNDVVDLMRRIRIVFVKKAILTAICGAFRDESAQ